MNISLCHRNVYFRFKVSCRKCQQGFKASCAKLIAHIYFRAVGVVFLDTMLEILISGFNSVDIES